MSDRTPISGGQAHRALGGDERFQPKRADKPASNRQLWALNLLGLLELLPPKKGSTLEPFDEQAVSHPVAEEER